MASLRSAMSTAMGRRAVVTNFASADSGRVIQSGTANGRLSASALRNSPLRTARKIGLLATCVTVRDETGSRS